ncbi:MAG: hypothetical protein EOO11_02475 [Chitinophagaceae bacterium]|nr:MAG: hypothetical protein EOO11_02475 [Chitinophagaceae bacterium]
MIPALLRPLCLALVLLASASGVSAQTAAIEYKSRGGSEASLDEYFEGAGADFGRVNPARRLQHPEVRLSHLDSVVLLSDSVALTVTGTYIVGKPGGAPRRRVTARVDTVRFAPQPSLRTSRDSLKAALTQGRSDSTRYIGFDGGPETTRVQLPKGAPAAAALLLPAGGGTDDPDAPVGLPLVLAGAALLASLLTGIIAWLYRRMPLVS